MTQPARPRSRLITRLIVAEALARPGQGPLARRSWPGAGQASARVARPASPEPTPARAVATDEPSEPRDA